MATHSSILAWKIPWIEEPGRHGKEADTTENYTLTFTPPVTWIRCNLSAAWTQTGTESIFLSGRGPVPQPTGL